ncbi:nipped-B protein, partial [Reticulomyxa filosa]
SIVDTFSFSMTTHTCVDDTPDLPKLFLTGKLPKMHLNMSTSLFHTLFEVLEGIRDIPFDDTVELQEPLLPPKEEMEELHQLAGHRRSTMLDLQGITMGSGFTARAKSPPLQEDNSNKDDNYINENDDNNDETITKKRGVHQSQMSEVMLADLMNVNELDQNQKMEVEIQKKTTPYSHFVCQFDMESFCLQLVDDHIDRDSCNYYKQPIVMFRSENLWINLDRTKERFEGHFRLKSLFVEDLFHQSGAGFNYLVTSEVQEIFPMMELSEQSEDLIFIYALSRPHIDNVTVACKFNALHVGWNPNSVFAIVKFVDRIVLMKDQMLKPSTIQTDASQANVPNTGIGTEASLSPTIMDVDMKMKFLAITLNTNDAPVILQRTSEKLSEQTSDDIQKQVKTEPEKKVWNAPKQYRSIARIINSNAHVEFHNYRKGLIHIIGELGNLNLKDLRKTETMYEDILSLKVKNDPQIGKFDYKLFDPAKLPAEEYPGFASKLEFSMNSIKFVYLQTFLTEMLYYVNTSITNVLFPPKPSTSTTPVPSTQSLNSQASLLTCSLHERYKNIRKEQMMFHIQTSNPLVIIPRHSMTPEYIKLDFGVALVSNECVIHSNQQDIVDILTVSTTKASFGSNTHFIANDIGIAMKYARKLNPQCSEPDYEMDIDIPFLNGLFRHEHYVLILNTIADNFGAQYTLPVDPLQANIVDESVLAIVHLKSQPINDNVDSKDNNNNNGNDNDNNVEETKNANEHVVTPPTEGTKKPPDTMLFRLRAQTVSLWLGHDLINGRASSKKLVKLDVTDFVIANVNFRSLESLFTVKFGSVAITDERKLSGQQFDKILCRYQDLFLNDTPNDAATKTTNKTPSMEMTWKTILKPTEKGRRQEMVINMNDPCSFAIGSVFRHVYDWFVTTANPFADEYKVAPANPNPPSKDMKDSDNDNNNKSRKRGELDEQTIEEEEEEDQMDELDESEEEAKANINSSSSNGNVVIVSTFDRDEFNVTVNLDNARIVLLRDLAKRDCDAVVTHGNIQYIYDWVLTPDVVLRHVELIHPSKFHYHSLLTQNRVNEDEIYKQSLSLDSIVIKG